MNKLQLINNEAETKQIDLNKVKILGVNVDITPMSRVIQIINEMAKRDRAKRPLNRAFFIVTAYSESLLEVETNLEFRQALNEASLILGDGVSVWAAADYIKHAKNNWFNNLIVGLKIGIKVIRGEYGDRPVGVEIFKKIITEGKQRVFLFGGFNGVAERLTKKYGGGWSEEDPKILEKINKYNPDILFVALGRFKQEIWIAKNLSKITAGVVIGVGSSFDEVAGEGVWRRPVPAWVGKMGLKWIWRTLFDIGHIKRAWRAFPVFPWKVYRQTNTG